MEISIKWNMCRACTCHSSSDLQPLFNDANTHIAQKLREYAGVVVEQNDGLPDKICVDCIEKLESVHKFLSSCKAADEHLKSVVNRTMSSKSCFQSLSNSVDNNPTTRATRIRKQTVADRQVDRQLKRIRLTPVEPQFEMYDTAEEELSCDPIQEETDDVELDTLDSVRADDSPNLVTKTTGTDLTEFLHVSGSPPKSEALENLSSLPDNDSNEYIILISEDENKHELAAVDNETTEYMRSDIVVDDGSTEDSVRNECIEARSSEIGAVDETYVLNEEQSLDLIEEDNAHHRKEKVIKTEQKNIASSSSVEFSINLRAACEGSNLSVYSCPVCGNSFPNQSQLKSHLRSHRNEKSYECELCSKRFNAACNLTTHMRTHTGEKPYECTFCARRFADRSTHRKHERIHTNERPYSCNICNKTFSLSTSLKAHEAVHSQQKPHRCVTCNKSFKLPHQLKAHENTHVHRYEAGIVQYDDADDYLVMNR